MQGHKAEASLDRPQHKQQISSDHSATPEAQADRTSRWLALAILLLFLQVSSARAQCPWTRDSVELHADCICDFNPSVTTLGQQAPELQQVAHLSRPINRMSVQCSPVDFTHLLRALKQTASIELPSQLAAALPSIVQADGSVVRPMDPDEPELQVASQELASQAKLDLLHVSNSSIGELANEAFLVDTASLGPLATGDHLAANETSAGANGPSGKLVVAIQSLHLVRCGIVALQPLAFSGLEWSLMSLSLSDNQLEWVPSAALAGLRNLRVLDLSNNRLSSVPANAFLALTRLNTLRLADNRLGLMQQEYELQVANRSTASQAIEALAFAGLESSLSDLSLKNTQLSALPGALANLRQLAFLNLAQNQISQLRPAAFEHMQALTAINLERNRIGRLEDETFKGVERSLSSLSLLGNLLDAFPTRPLAPLEALRRLDLGFNSIDSIPSDAFSAHRKLILVALDGNPLDTLPEAAFKPLEASLRGMSVGGKALNCDCRLSWMLRWQLDYNLQISSRERKPQFCAKPFYLRSLVSFSALKPEHLTCPAADEANGTSLSLQRAASWPATEPTLTTVASASLATLLANLQQQVAANSSEYLASTQSSLVDELTEAATDEQPTPGSLELAEFSSPASPTIFGQRAPIATDSGNQLASLPDDELFAGAGPRQKLNRHGYLANSQRRKLAARWNETVAGGRLSKPAQLEPQVVRPKPTGKPTLRPIHSVFGDRASPTESQRATVAATRAATVTSFTRSVSEEPPPTSRVANKSSRLDDPDFQQARRTTSSFGNKQLLDTDIERHSPAASVAVHSRLERPATPTVPPTFKPRPAPGSLAVNLELSRLSGETTTTGAPLTSTGATSPWFQQQQQVSANNSRMSVSSMYRTFAAAATSSSPAPPSSSAWPTYSQTVAAFSTQAAGAQHSSPSAVGRDIERKLHKKTTSRLKLAADEQADTSDEQNKITTPILLLQAPPAAASSSAPDVETATRMATTIRVVDTFSPTQFRSSKPASSGPVQPPTRPATSVSSTLRPPELESVRLPAGSSTSTTGSSTSTLATPTSTSTTTTTTTTTSTTPRPAPTVAHDERAGQVEPAGARERAPGSSVAPLDLVGSATLASEQPTTQLLQVATSRRSSAQATAAPSDDLLRQRPKLVTKESTLNGRQGRLDERPARSLAHYVSLADFDQVALVLAGLLCLFILVLALTICCLCYASWSARAAKRRRGHQQQVAVGPNSSSSLTSDPDYSTTGGCLSRWLLCCCSGGSRKRVTPMRSLILQDDDNFSSGGGGAKLAGKSSSGTSMLLAASDSSGGSSTGSGQNLFASVRKASLALAAANELAKPRATKQKRQATSKRPLDHQAAQQRHRQAHQALELDQQPARTLGRRGTSMLELPKAADCEWACRASPSSCDSDKSWSPGANKNNRYNIGEAHRAYLAGAQQAHQVQASRYLSTSALVGPPPPMEQLRAGGLLKTIEQQQQQLQAPATRAHFDYFDRLSRISSDKSTTDDSRAPLQQVGATARRALSLLRADRQPERQSARQPKATRTFGQAPGTSLARSRSSARPPADPLPSSGSDRLHSEPLLPMSAEEQWPEPYDEPLPEEAGQELAVGAHSLRSQAEPMAPGEHQLRRASMHHRHHHHHHHHNKSQQQQQHQHQRSRIITDEAYLSNWHTIGRPDKQQVAHSGQLYSNQAAEMQQVAPSCASLARFRPKMNQPPRAMGATSWLRWEMPPPPPSTCPSDQLDSQWHRDNQLESMYVAPASANQHL